MDTVGFAPIGLLLAAAMSVTNVMTDVWRKRALDRRVLDSHRGGGVFRRGAAGTDAARRAGGDPRCGPIVRPVPTGADADLFHLPRAGRGADHHRDVALLPGAADFAAFDVHSVPGLHPGVPDPEHLHHSGTEAGAHQAAGCGVN